MGVENPQERKESDVLKRTLTEGELLDHLGNLIAKPVEIGAKIIGIPIKFLIKTAQIALNEKK
ncbi:MAG: hypothetical protein AABY22_18155 [Nanoarchaeota archaeon]